MPTVFVVQEVHGRNLLPAAKFGTLELLLPADRQIVLAPHFTVQMLRRKLNKFSDDDYILASGDPTAIGIVTALACYYNHGKFKMLKFDRQQKIYYEVKVDISGKLDEDE